MSLENVKQRVLVISRHLCTYAYSPLLQCQREVPFLSFCLKLKATNFQESCMMTSVLQPLLVCVIKLYQTNERDKSKPIWMKHP